MATLLLMYLFACQHDNALAERTDVETPYKYPVIERNPPSINFGELGYRMGREEVFTIDNVGEDTLELKGIKAVVGELEFELLATDLPREDDPATTDVDETRIITLEPGDPPIEIPVAFTALAPGMHVEQIAIKSNDEMNSLVYVDLEGTGLMPYLEVYPNPIVADDTFVGCEDTKPATLRNAGNQSLDVTSVVSEGAAFSVIPPTLPYTLDPGESVEVQIGFAPRIAGEASGNLVVESTDPRGVQEAIEVGEGAFPGSFTDTYEVPLGGKVDVLVWVDQSRSMDDDQQALIANYGHFIDGLHSLTEDWQMIVVTGNTGCNVSGGILRPDTPDLEARFTAAVQEGEDSWWSEAGLYVTELALQQTTPFTCNDGFIREDEDAFLHVIIITDEPDDSPELPSTYVRRFQALKGGASRVKVSAVAGDIPSGCDAYDDDGNVVNSAAPGTGYDEAVAMTHGAFVSLCSDWPSQISTLSGYGRVQTTFDLSARPNEETLQTTVDGLPRVGDHYYDRDAGAVVFTENPPFQGQRVVFSYDAPLVCAE